MAEGTPFIAGIEHYCDRWCRKCRFTARCAEFARRHPLAIVPPVEADGQQALLRHLHHVLDTLSQILRRLAPGDDSVTAAAADAPAGPARGRDAERATGEATLDPSVRCDPLVLGASAYTEMVGAWFADARGWLDDRRLALRARIEASADPLRAVGEAEALCDALDTVLWDRTTIATKLPEAVAASRPPCTAGTARHADGCAKVALLSIDRSVGAWLTVRAQRRGLAESIVPTLALLAELGRAVESRFPRSRAFVRPGFDTRDRGAPDRCA